MLPLEEALQREKERLDAYNKQLWQLEVDLSVLEHEVSRVQLRAKQVELKYEVSLCERRIEQYTTRIELLKQEGTVE